MSQRNFLDDICPLDWYIGPPFSRSSCWVPFKPCRVKLIYAIILELLVGYFLWFVVGVYSCRVKLGTFCRESADCDSLI